MPAATATPTRNAALAVAITDDGRLKYETAAAEWLSHDSSPGGGLVAGHNNSSSHPDHGSRALPETAPGCFPGAVEHKRVLIASSASAAAERMREKSMARVIDSDKAGAAQNC
jgi:hypothetical protein